MNKKMPVASALNEQNRYRLVGLTVLGVAGIFVIGVSRTLTGNSEIFSFCALLLSFCALALLIVRPNFSRLTDWWVYVILLQFGFAPLMCHLLDVSVIDAFDLTALALVFLGTSSFWVGTRLLQRNVVTSAFHYSPPEAENRRIHMGMVMLVIGCLAKLYMVRAGLFMYGSDINSVEAASQYREWLTILGGFTIYAQILLTIEFFGGERTMQLKTAFWATTGANVLFSLISGMKGELLILPLSFFLVKKLVTGKIEWQLVGGMGLLFMFLFPLNYAYRSEVLSQGSVTSLGGGKSALGRAFGTMGESSTGDYITSSVESVANRLNLLPNIVFLNEERTRGNTIEGDERLWMIPFYPFVPRFLWKDKPVLDKGRRLNIAMGSTEFSSTAVTPFGDLLMMGGPFALVAGMMGLGVVFQLVMGLIRGEFGPKSLFIYCILFCRFYSPESDIVLLGTTMIQLSCVAFLVAYFVYGGKLFSVKSYTVR
jgi:hypothetical protein